MKLLLNVISFSIALICSSTAFAVDHTNDNFASGRVIVQFKEESNVSKYLSTAEIAPLVNGHDLKTVNTLVPYDKIEKIQKRQVKAGYRTAHVKSNTDRLTRLTLLRFEGADREETLDIIEKLNNDPQVEYAEPDHLVRCAALPNDPHFPEQWGFEAINAEQAWDVTTGSNEVIVGVVDTGVDLDHPDLQANLVAGYDYRNEDSDPDDDHDHGTHMAGIIGAVGNNGLGVTGVAWNVRIMPLKFAGSDGTGYISDAIQCIDHGVANGAHIINNSWSSDEHSDGESLALLDAIQRAEQAGVLFVAAAGNDSRDIDITPSYPASYDTANIISVAATDSEEILLSRSNWGAGSVDIAAPGLAFSTMTDGEYGTNPAPGGTSVAAAYVSGVAALIKSIHPDWTYLDIKDRIMTVGAAPLPDLQGKTVTGGLIDAYEATATTPPGDQCTGLEVSGFDVQDIVNGTYTRSSDVTNNQPVWESNTHTIEFGVTSSNNWEILRKPGATGAGRPAICDTGGNPGDGPFSCTDWREWRGSGWGFRITVPAVFNCLE